MQDRGTYLFVPKRMIFAKKIELLIMFTGEFPHRCNNVFLTEENETPGVAWSKKC